MSTITFYVRTLDLHVSYLFLVSYARRLSFSFLQNHMSVLQSRLSISTDVHHIIITGAAT